jgi:hypothetical protein
MVGFVSALGANSRVAIAAAADRQMLQFNSITFVFGSEQALCQLDEKRLLRLAESATANASSSPHLGISRNWGPGSADEGRCVLSFAEESENDGLCCF